MTEPEATRAFPWWSLQLLGIGLFLFIPLVLFLFVTHPPPIGASLAIGIGLMVGHRRLARPYMDAVRRRKCVWCNRELDAPAAAPGITVAQGRELIRFHTCSRHHSVVAKVVGHLDRWRWVLRVGILVPLAILLGSLLAVAIGAADGTYLPVITAGFQLVVGLTVNLAALGGWLPQRNESNDLQATPRAPFPVHNFYLLGLATLLWIFRLVGVVWIVRGAAVLIQHLA